MKFRVLVGIHSQDGKVYEAGDIVESDLDLMKIYTCNAKFERVSESVTEIDETDDDFGENVTEKFKGASEMNLMVFHKGHKYTVLNGSTMEPLHKTEITRKDAVVEFIKGLK